MGVKGTLSKSSLFFTGTVHDLTLARVGGRRSDTAVLAWCQYSSPI